VLGVRLRATNETIVQLTSQLQAYTGRPVIDRTGLNGAFDFTLTWLQESQGGTPGVVPVDSRGLPTLFTAVREQLGLSLDAAKFPMPLIVIDSIQRPTEN
jgi:uncharacterized protein (TIGR03435 family)